MRTPLRVISERRKNDLIRQRLVLQSPQGPSVQVDGQRYLNFCSNDYLGLANHPQVRDAWIAGLTRYGCGAAASHWVCGHSEAHEQLEQRIAAMLGRQRALLFSSGYTANLGVIQAFCQRGDRIFLDRNNHASLVDGAVLARARLFRYRHRDIGSLRRQLGREDSGSAMVITDGVFSMDGDLAPLPEIAELTAQHRGQLYVDDAHGFGVIGDRGLGTLEYFQLNAGHVPLLMITLGKAIGLNGAVVAGDAELIEMLIQLARPAIYSTALPPAQAVAAGAALDLMQHQTWRRKHLKNLIKNFRQGAEHRALKLAASITPIQPLLLGDSARALQLSAALRQQGILVTAIRPPTVPEGTARLRITLTAAHSDGDIERLLDTLAKCL